MASITTRQTAGSGATVKNLPLSNSEIDNNFINLNTAKIEETDAVSTNTVNKVVRRDAAGGFSAGALSLSSTLGVSGAATLSSTLAVTGNTTLTADLAVNGGDITTTAATATVFNTNATTVNAFGAATNITLGAATGTLTINNPSVSATNANFSFKSLGVGTTASGTTGEIRATGDISSNYSDERLKENIELIDSALNKVDQLRGVTFTPNTIAESYGYKKQQEVGVIAQDVQKVLPEAIRPAPFDTILYEGQEVSRSGEHYLTVQYDKLVPLLIEAIKELNKEIKELKGVK